MLYKIDRERIEIKFEVKTNFKMAAIANFVGWRHKSRDSTPCNCNTWRYWLFCCYYRHSRHVKSLPNHGTLIVFQDKHQTTQAFVGPSHFWSHTSLVTSVVYSSASACRTAWGTACSSCWTHLLLLYFGIMWPIFHSPVILSYISHYLIPKCHIYI